MALSTNLFILCNDVSTNPGPIDHCVNLSSSNSSFSSVSEESFMSPSSTSDTDDENCSSTYFNLGQGDDGLRIGHWNVNFLTSAKFNQIRLFLLGDSSSGRPQLDILFLRETFLKPSVPDSLYAVPGFSIYRREREKFPHSPILHYACTSY